MKAFKNSGGVRSNSLGGSIKEDHQDNPYLDDHEGLSTSISYEESSFMNQTASRVGESITTSMFLNFLNPRFRGKNLKEWDQLVSLIERIIKTTLFTSFSAERWQASSELLIKLALKEVPNTLKGCLRELGITKEEYFTFAKIRGSGVTR